jgi:hypothetical protein
MTVNVEIVVDDWRTLDQRRQKRDELRDTAFYRASVVQFQQSPRDTSAKFAYSNRSSSFTFPQNNQTTSEYIAQSNGAA